MSEVTSESDKVPNSLDSIDHWLDMYREGKSPWHCQDRHQFLNGNIEVLFGDSGMKGKVFIPMCGKAVEMSWFSELGHSVVGVEVSPIPIKDFFAENNLQYSVEEIDKIQGQLYRAESVDIKIYCCDIFNFNKDVESDFDAIWDSGALGATRPEDRRQYAELMVSLMTNDCRYLACTVYYGDKARAEAGIPPEGAPYVIHLDQVQEIFTSLCQVEILVKRPKDNQQLGGKDVSQEIEENIYSIKKC